MDTDVVRNRQLVDRFFAMQASGDLLQCLDLCTDDMIWVVPGDWEMSGSRDKAEMRAMLGELSQFEGGLAFEHSAVVAERDQVAVFTRVGAKLRDGRTYRNEIAFLFVIRGERIARIVEAPDSAKSRRFWLGK